MILIHVAVKDAETLRDFVLDSFAERPKAAHIETAVIYEQVRNWKLIDQGKQEHA